MDDAALVKAQAHVECASRARLNGNLFDAISELVLASECYVEQLQCTSDKQSRKELVVAFNRCTEEAEGLKKLQYQRPVVEPVSGNRATHKEIDSSANGVAGSLASPLDKPATDVAEVRSIPKKEQLILLKSSRIGNRVFPIWNEKNLDQHLNPGEPFVDSTRIFPEDWDFIEGYVRISEVFSDATLRSDDIVLHTTLAQTTINDCSLVASLIVAAQWSNRFGEPFTRNLLYPQDAQGPIVSTYGKYLLRIHLNGTWRLVVIDDYLPLGANGTCKDVLVFSSLYPQIIWPALVQKAFWKVAGTNFKGSDSASDLRLLTGWIPERRSLRVAVADFEPLWNHLISSWTYGDVLITLGSGRLSREEEADLSIISEHSYAVVRVFVIDNRKSMTLQNPWQGLADKVGIDETSLSYKTTFDLEFDQVLQRFDMLSLNWNPRLYKYVLTTHMSISAEQFSITEYNLSKCPQHVITNMSRHSVETLVVLSRHRQADANSAITTYSFMALYDANGEQVITSANPALRTDDEGALELTLRASVPPAVSYTLVIGQRNPLSVESMTLNIYHAQEKSALHLSTPSSIYSTQDSLTQDWSGSGGNPSLKTFSKNPQFLLTLQQVTNIKVLLEAPGVDVNLDIVHTHTRPLRIDKSTRIVSGKEYRRDHQMVTATLQPGHYSIIPSTYRPNHVSPFKLSWFADCDVLLEAARPLGTGQLKKIVASHWSNYSSIQCFYIISERSNQFTIHVHPFSQQALHRVTLLLESRTTAEKTVVNVEGRGSLGLEKVSVSGQKVYSLVCEILEPVKDGEFEVQIYSDGVVSVSRA